MASAPLPAVISPPREPLVDARTGTISRTWFLFLQQIQRNLEGSGNADVLTLTDERTILPNSLRLEFADPLVATEDASGGTVSVNLRNTPVTPGAYGSASKTVSFTVTPRGRINAAAEFALNTTNITEGSNKYFTNSRARNVISAGSGIAYDSSSGVISLDPGGFSGTVSPVTSITVVDGIVTAVS